MAKANLVLPDGTKVNIKGNADEVALLLAKFSQPSKPETSQIKAEKKKKKPSGGSSKSKGTSRKGPQPLISELAKEGFFKSKRSIADIQKKLEEKGHIYAQTSLSTPLVRLTRNGTLRRIKEKKVWVYVS